MDHVPEIVGGEISMIIWERKERSNEIAILSFPKYSGDLGHWSINFNRPNLTYWLIDFDQWYLQLNIMYVDIISRIDVLVSEMIREKTEPVDGSSYISHLLQRAQRIWWRSILPDMRYRWSEYNGSSRWHIPWFPFSSCICCKSSSSCSAIALSYKFSSKTCYFLGYNYSMVRWWEWTPPIKFWIH